MLKGISLTLEQLEEPNKRLRNSDQKPKENVGGGGASTRRPGAEEENKANGSIEMSLTSLVPLGQDLKVDDPITKPPDVMTSLKVESHRDYFKIGKDNQNLKVRKSIDGVNMDSPVTPKKMV